MEHESELSIDVVSRLLIRFPKQDFLETLDIIDPQQWKSAHDINFQWSRSYVISCINEKESKLTSDFLKKCKY